MEYLQARWHRNIQAIEAAKPSNSNENWKPLIKNTCIDEININIITSEILLKQHGKEMNHCVGGYAELCIQNKTNILELVDKYNVKSTLELKIRENKVYIEQHKGIRDSTPNRSHQQVAQKLVSRMNNGSIALNQERLHEKPVISDKPAFPYDINDLATQETIYQVYKSKKLLPSGLIATNYQEMLKKSQLLLCMESIIEENTRSHGDENVMESNRLQ